MNAGATDRVLRRLLVVQACRGAYFWLPTSYLLFQARFGDGPALSLLGLYYLAGVVLEVPSGYASDRLGRRVTLVVAMAMLAAGSAAVAFGPGLAWSVAGQVLVAGGGAFVSGTDTALLFDHLKADGRLDDLRTWEARRTSVSFAATGAACVVGGFAATGHLAAGYALSAVAGAVGFVAALGLVDARAPDRHAGAERGELGRLAAQLRRPRLAWLAGFAVAMQLFNHVPLELHQPYLRALGVGLLAGDAPTEVSGLVLGAMMALAATASRLSPRVAGRFGAHATLLVCFAAQSAIVWTMALVLHPAVLLVIASRGVPHGVALPVRNELVHRELEGPLRATWFSAQTLAGSLLLALTLFGAATAVGGPLEQLDPAGLARVLGAYGLAAAVVLAALAVARPRA